MPRDLEPVTGVSPVPTPWAVRCWRHGLVYLTHEEYVRQLDDPDRRWVCPIPRCSCVASWDDDNYDQRRSW